MPVAAATGWTPSAGPATAGEGGEIRDSGAGCGGYGHHLE